MNYEQSILALQARAACPGYAPVSPELARAIAKHNDDVGANYKRIEDRHDTFGKATANVAAGGGDIGDLFAAVDSVRLDLANVVQLLAANWANRKALIERALKEFTPELPAAEAELAKVVARVKSELTKIGSGVEAQPASIAAPGHGDAAEAQFDYMARNLNVHSRRAVAAVGDAHARIDAATEQLRISNEGIEEVRQLVVRVAQRLVAA